MKIITTKQMKALESESVNHGVSLAKLMDNAGKALADFICSLYDKREINCGKNITFLAGSGNNGGDCFVAARELVYCGFNVSVVCVCDKPQTNIALDAFNKMPSDRINIIEGFKSKHTKKTIEAAELSFMSVNGSSNENSSANQAQMEQIQLAEKKRTDAVFNTISKSDVIVDGVFGTGFRGKLDEEIISFFKAADSKIKISVDVPSGGNCTYGSAAEGIFNADYTVAFGFLKSGMTQYPLKQYCGKIKVCEIGIPDKALELLNDEADMQLADESCFSNLIKPRMPDSHKGDFGRLLIIAGSRNMRGACVMAAESALRCGVGIVCTASVEETINTASIKIPESILLPLDCDYDGFMLYENNLDLLKKELGKADAVLFGCGLGVTNDTIKLTEFIIENAECPVIIDADGINCLAADVKLLQKKRSDIILTPHPAEMSRLIGKSVSDIQSDRINTALNFAEEYNVTVVLKGAGTVTAQSQKCIVNTTGNSGMSKGGSGDVLAGIVSSLSAQGYTPFEAASFGAYIHGMAGDFAAEKLGVQFMLPSDIINELSAVFKNLS